MQPWNAGNAAADLIRARFKHHTQPELLFSLFGHGFMVDAVDMVVAPEAATATAAMNLEKSDATISSATKLSKTCCNLRLSHTV